MIDAAVGALLDMGGSLAATFVARDSPNFSVAQGMMAIIVLVGIVLAIALVLWRWKKSE